MKDLDFDELDRAVNSLISNKTSDTNADSVKPEPTSDVPAADQPVVAPETSPLVSRPNTGRFMDVVPPSVSTKVTPSEPVQIYRQGMSLEPVSTKPVESETEASVPVVTPEPAQPASTEPMPNAWPDPLDFQKIVGSDPVKTEEPKLTVKDEYEDADIDQISNEIDKTMGQVAEQPQDSPFISGTKVEKRPLGAFSTEPSTSTEPVAEPVSEPAPESEPTVTESPASVEDAVVSAPEATTTMPPDSVVTPLPAELHNDLLSIESSTTNQPAQPTAEEVTAAAEVSAPTPEPITVSDSQPTATASIPQQYKEQPSSGDQTSGAIYDTDAYHKALVNPSKKKSGWMWIVWIVLLLVVGAGAGAAVYFLVLPRL